MIRHESKETRLIYPGSHVIWSPVTLPPWPPNRFAAALLNEAKEELWDRLETILTRLRDDRNIRKRTPIMASVGPDHRNDPKPKKPKYEEINENIEEDEEKDYYT